MRIGLHILGNKMMMLLEHDLSALFAKSDDGELDWHPFRDALTPKPMQPRIRPARGYLS